MRRKLRPLVRVVSAGVVLSGMAGCGFPHDPDHTLQHVRGGTMRVGVAENPPWVFRAGNAPGPSAAASGVEADLVQAFAQRLHARVEWIWGTESTQMQALETNNLDLVIAGLTTQTPWQGQVGLTKPYYTEHILVGIPPGMPWSQNLSKRRVAVEQGTTLIHLLKKQHAVPVPIPGLMEMPSPPPGLPVAAPRWLIEKWGLIPTKTELDQAQHVIAVPPGENRWLMQWEEFLQTQRAQVRRMLPQQEAGV